jgi:CDP-diacylglycerol--serine O-phosphatidyltransferase
MGAADLGKLGWIAAFIYCAGAALRLARFNTNARSGRQALLPGPAFSPAAAALVAGLVWVMIDNGIAGNDVRWLACVLTIFAGVTMVQRAVLQRQGINLRKSVPFIVIARSCSALRWFQLSPWHALFGLFLAYGPATCRRLRGARLRTHPPRRSPSAGTHRTSRRRRRRARRGRFIRPRSKP